MDSKIHAFLRVAAPQGRDTEQVGPFLATYDRHTDTPFRNYAIPDADAEPATSDVEALITAYERRGRRPRLEYLPSIAPAVEPALLAAGFSVEGLLPVMTVTREAARDLPAPQGVEVAIASTGGDLLDAAIVQDVAYGGTGANPQDVDRLRALLDAGGVVVLARAMDTGEPIGSGLYSAPVGGVTEIAAIGVVPTHRRRGVASAVVTALMREAFRNGIATPFLMVEHEIEGRIYARAGFVDTTRILLISVPAAE